MSLLRSNLESICIYHLASINSLVLMQSFYLPGVMLHTPNSNPQELKQVDFEFEASLHYIGLDIFLQKAVALIVFMM